MKRLIAATALAVIVTAGCSSSVDNPPDVSSDGPDHRQPRSARHRHAVAEPRVVLAEPGHPALPA